jgi:LPS sulfotransferase NodH
MMLNCRSRVCRFVLLFEGRTGSSYLIESLNSHPKVCAYGEALREYGEKGGSQAQLTWVQKTLTAPILSRHSAIGFKTKLRVIVDQDAFAKVLQEMNTKILYMQRRNRIKAVISTIRSCQLKDRTGEYNLYKEGDSLPPSSINIKDFAWELKFREELDLHLEKFIHKLGLHTLPLYYENLLKNETDTLRSIYDFLGVPFQATKGKAFKSTSNNLREVIVNFDEIRSPYIGTPYESMFDEV